MLDRDPDQVGSSRKAELVLYVAAIIRHGLVAEADRIGDLQQAVAFAEEPENLQVAARQILEGVHKGEPRDARTVSKASSCAISGSMYSCPAATRKMASEIWSGGAFFVT